MSIDVLISIRMCVSTCSSVRLLARLVLARTSYACGAYVKHLHTSIIKINNTSGLAVEVEMGGREQSGQNNDSELLRDAHARQYETAAFQLSLAHVCRLCECAVVWWWRSKRAASAYV